MGALDQLTTLHALVACALGEEPSLADVARACIDGGLLDLDREVREGDLIIPEGCDIGALVRLQRTFPLRGLVDDRYGFDCTLLQLREAAWREVGKLHDFFSGQWISTLEFPPQYNLHYLPHLELLVLTATIVFLCHAEDSPWLPIRDLALSQPR